MADVAATMIGKIIAFALGAAAAAGVAELRIDKLNSYHATAILAMRFEASERAKEAAADAQDQQREISTQYQKAINDALENQSILRADAVRARSQLASLRSQTQAAASRIAMPDTAPATIAEYATTAGELLTECSREHQELAEKADQHAASVRLMLDAWPTLR
jgi:hypothetical protein